MSDPVTNAEIEDVLSSIRRLVSEDARQTVRPRSEERPKTPDRLVLTPSLRVSDEARDEAPGEAPAAGGDEVTGAVAAEDRQEPEEAGPADHAGEPVAAEAAPWRDPEATLYAAAAVHAPDDHAPDDDDTPPEEDWPPDVEAAGAADAEDTDTAGHDPSDEPSGPDGDAAGAAGLAGAFEAVRAAMDDTPEDQWEPHGDEPGDFATAESEALEWRDLSEEEAEVSGHDGDHADAVADAYDHDDADEDGDDAQDLFSDEETILDEATLRELVTDIVREELQGALGERITRNVRKMVRREINRALSIQELE